MPPLDPRSLAFGRFLFKFLTRAQSNNAVVYVSNDGRFLIRGELDDMLADPFASTRAHLHLSGSDSENRLGELFPDKWLAARRATANS